MGIKLMVEIFDHWQDAGLTVGERSDLLVLAENANDGTRQTFGPVHAEYILRRAGKTAASWRVAINKLMKKKVLEYATREGRELRGHTGQSAVYRLVPLCSSPPHSGYKGHCTKPASTGGGEGHRSGDPSGLGYPADNPVKGEAPEEGYPAATPGEPSDNPVDGVGYPAATEWVISQITPTPLYPSFKISSTTPSSSPAEPVESEPTAEPDVTDGGGGGGSDLRSIAEHITASLDYQDQVPDKQQQAKLTAAILAALEKGWSTRGLTRYLFLDGYRPDNPVAFYLSKLSPKKLPDMEPAEPSAALSRGGALGRVASAEEINATTVDSLFGWAQEGGHRPYSNPVDQSVYDEPWTVPAPSQPPWCGELECCETDRMRDVEDDRGFKFAKPCEKCHPDRARAA
jgi:hypothetical protein